MKKKDIDNIQIYFYQSRDLMNLVVKYPLDYIAIPVDKNSTIKDVAKQVHKLLKKHYIIKQSTVEDALRKLKRLYEKSR